MLADRGVEEEEAVGTTVRGIDCGCRFFRATKLRSGYDLKHRVALVDRILG
jgi:hypothetical protein